MSWNADAAAALALQDIARQAAITNKLLEQLLIALNQKQVPTHSRIVQEELPK